MPAGQEYAGFLSDYSKLKPNPNFENTVSFVQDDPAKNIHRYMAVIIDPPVVYVATNANPNEIPDRGRAALTEYWVEQNSAISSSVPGSWPAKLLAGKPRIVRPSKCRSA